MLVVEDNPLDAEIVIRELQQAGFEPDWQRVQTASEFLAALDSHPDIILSDYALPQFDGLQAADLLRERGLDTPFILISGTVGEELAVSAIKRGADDYLMKDRLARRGSAVLNALTAKRMRDERLSSAAKARKIGEQYRLISENTADIIWTFDIRSMRITWVSPSVRRLTGREPAEIVAGKIDDFLTPQSVALVMKRLQRALGAFAAGDAESLRTQTTEVEHLHREGPSCRPRWSRASSLTRRDVRRPSSASAAASASAGAPRQRCGGMPKGGRRSMRSDRGISQPKKS